MHAYTKFHCIANLVFRFVEAVNSFKDDVVKMPDRAQMERNSAYIYISYGMLFTGLMDVTSFLTANQGKLFVVKSIIKRL